jgi:small subunit ribosomal protein S9
MAVKKVKESKIKKQEEKNVPKDKYFYAVGKRKTAIAQVRLYLENKEIKGIFVNKKEVGRYFPIVRLRDTAITPLVATNNQDKFGVVVKISGGGISSQAEAMRLAIARALVKFDETLKKQLRVLGYMTRDARVVERKKPGLKKARRAPQWAKR